MQCKLLNLLVYMFEQVLGYFKFRELIAKLTLVVKSESDKLQYSWETSNWPSSDMRSSAKGCQKNKANITLH